MRWQISALVLWLATSDKSLGFAFLAGWLMMGNTTNQKVIYIYIYRFSHGQLMLRMDVCEFVEYPKFFFHLFHAH